MVVRLPIHRVLYLAGTDIVVAAFGNHFLAANARTGEVVAAPKSVIAAQAAASSAHAIDDEEFPTSTILHLAFHSQTHQLAVSADNKQLICWDVRTWKKLSSRISIKRASCLSFSKDGAKLIIGDKFGDVYTFKSNNASDKEALILGHVSLLTSMTLTHDGNYILTADRDEKVRVSRFPLAFDIVQFCLGHEKFVSAIHIPAFAPDLLISGGGDQFLLTWNFMAGRIVQKIPLDELEGQVAVSAIESHAATKVVAVILDSLKKVLLYDAADSTNLKLIQKLDLPTDPLHVCFDNDGHLWIALAPRPEGNLVEIARYTAGTFAISPSDPVLSQINTIPTPGGETVPDFYTATKLRKAEGHPPGHAKRKPPTNTPKAKAKRAKKANQ
ncbi:tRNA (guanine-N(7)-)-methyltransferase non-catalytic subunit trm82 [Geranomyces variabilis]|uniref:tRNA (Guanine-N(7)-)-methyltransferase non-catalytic subunit trm82 n=1 Tax=Geranomyces variabilis TaxID=109894 RepID=A0AAD5XL02_9FUNG|nr:tRNA (guanine-N(7)-)-methyltransferase non-catalytic subunit trm82 [Geranomyces variabilis]